MRAPAYVPAVAIASAHTHARAGCIAPISPEAAKTIAALTPVSSQPGLESTMKMSMPSIRATRTRNTKYIRLRIRILLLVGALCRRPRYRGRDSCRNSKAIFLTKLLPDVYQIGLGFKRRRTHLQGGSVNSVGGLSERRA